MNPASSQSHSTAIAPPRPATTASSSLSNTLEPFSSFQHSCEKQIAESKRHRESLEIFNVGYGFIMEAIAKDILKVQKNLIDCQGRISDYKSEQLGEDELEKKQALIRSLQSELEILQQLEPMLQAHNWI